MSGLRVLQAAQLLYRAMPTVAWEREEFSGTVELADDIRNVILSDYLVFTVRDKSGMEVVATKVKDLHNGTPLELTVQAPASHKTAFVESLDALLRRFDFKHTPPDAFFIANENFLWRKDSQGEPHGNTVPTTVRLYLETLALIDKLKMLSDHVDDNGSNAGVILLVPGRKLVVPIDYQASDLGDVEPLIRVFEDAQNERTTQAYQIILKTTLVSALESVSPDDRFAFLLRNTTVLADAYSRNAELHASGFSFETEREAMLARKRDYILEINRTIGDIQTKLLAIPISLVLVGGQMAPADSPEECWANTAVLLGAVVFAILMFFLAHVQWNSLTTISKEIKGRKERWLKEFPSAAATMDDDFKELRGRVRRVRVLQTLILVLVVGCVAFAAWLYYAHTPGGLGMCFPTAGD